MKNQLVITKKEQLSLLLSHSKFNSILINLPNFNEDCNSYWTTKIEKVYNACGCKTGYRSMVLGFIASLVYIGFYINSFMESPFINFAKLFGFTIIMAVLGKGLGLLIAKIKLRKFVDEIKIIG